jgi:putative acetyltransferase
MKQPIIHVRKFRAGEAQALIDIFRSSVRGVARRDYTEEQVVAWAPDDIDCRDWEAHYAGRDTFVAEIDSTAVGFTDLEPDGHLDMMFVHAHHQGRGVASALLQSLESRARSLGIREIDAEVSLTARGFFERCGFRLIGTQIVTMRGQRLINHRMNKALSTAPSAQ